MSANTNTRSPNDAGSPSTPSHPDGDQVTLVGISHILWNAEPDIEFEELYDRCVEAGHIDPEGNR